MPTRKKEIVISPLDATETISPDAQESLANKPEKPKRKPAQPKLTTTETTDLTLSVEPTVIEVIEASETTTLVPAELEIVTTEEVKAPELLVRINKKQRKETHTKEKFYIRNDLLERLKALTKGKGNKSIKTTFINDALEKSLNELNINNN